MAEREVWRDTADHRHRRLERNHAASQGDVVPPKVHRDVLFIARFLWGRPSNHNRGTNPVVSDLNGVDCFKELGQSEVNDGPGMEDSLLAKCGQPVVLEVGHEAGGPGVRHCQCRSDT